MSERCPKFESMFATGDAMERLSNLDPETAESMEASIQKRKRAR